MLGANLSRLRRPDSQAIRAARASRLPISRWYLHPLAVRVAERLAPSRVRPWQTTLLGLASAVAAAAVLVWRPGWAAVAALLVWLAWFCDRTDGLLARRQGTASAWGAWLDANVDELVDVGLQVALAAAVATPLGWGLLIAFLAGKYLFMYGLSLEAAAPPTSPAAENADASRGWLRRFYHLPGNADVRVHLLLLALVSGFWTAELALVAGYYQLRWIVRYGLVARRLGGAR